MASLDRIDLRCVLDADLRIVQAESPSGLCDAAAIVGTKFLASISEPTLREFYRMVLARVRALGALTFTLRCDTPELKRVSTVLLRPVEFGGVGGIEVINSTQEERPHGRRVDLLDPEVPRGPDFLVICSWCKRVRLENERWLEPEEATRELRLFEQSVLPRLSHGLCADCAAGVRAQFERQVGELAGPEA